MGYQKICLASDNWTCAHPSIIEAVVEANKGHAPAYGMDPWTNEAQSLIQAKFRKECEVYFVPTGTGSNIFAFKLCCRSYESIICQQFPLALRHVECQTPWTRS